MRDLPDVCPAPGALPLFPGRVKTCDAPRERVHRAGEHARDEKRNHGERQKRLQERDEARECPRPGDYELQYFNI